MSLTIPDHNIATVAWLECYLRSMTACSPGIVLQRTQCHVQPLSDNAQNTAWLHVDCFICQRHLTTMSSSLNIMPRVTSDMSANAQSSQPQNTTWLHVTKHCTTMASSFNTMSHETSVWYRSNTLWLRVHCVMYPGIMLHWTVRSTQCHKKPMSDIVLTLYDCMIAVGIILLWIGNENKCFLALAQNNCWTV